MAGKSARDYEALRAEFITSDLRSLTEFGKSKGIPKSALARKAREKDASGMNWYEHQAAYRARVSDKAFDLVADAEAVVMAARQRKIMDVAEEVIDLFKLQRPAIEEQIANGKMPIGVRDLVAVAEMMRSMMSNGGKHESDEKKPPISLQQLFVNGHPGSIKELEHALRSEPTDAGGSSGTPEADSPAASAG